MSSQVVDARRITEDMVLVHRRSATASPVRKKKKHTQPPSTSTSTSFAVTLTRKPDLKEQTRARAQEALRRTQAALGEEKRTKEERGKRRTWLLSSQQKKIRETNSVTTRFKNAGAVVRRLREEKASVRKPGIPKVNRGRKTPKTSAQQQEQPQRKPAVPTFSRRATSNVVEDSTTVVVGGRRKKGPEEKRNLDLFIRKQRAARRAAEREKEFQQQQRERHRLKQLQDLELYSAKSHRSSSSGSSSESGSVNGGKKRVINRKKRKTRTPAAATQPFWGTSRLTHMNPLSTLSRVMSRNASSSRRSNAIEKHDTFLSLYRRSHSKKSETEEEKNESVTTTDISTGEEEDDTEDEQLLDSNIQQAAQTVAAMMIKEAQRKVNNASAVSGQSVEETSVRVVRLKKETAALNARLELLQQSTERPVRTQDNEQIEIDVSNVGVGKLSTAAIPPEAVLYDDDAEQQEIEEDIKDEEEEEEKQVQVLKVDETTLPLPTSENAVEILRLEAERIAREMLSEAIKKDPLLSMSTTATTPAGLLLPKPTSSSKRKVKHKRKIVNNKVPRATKVSSRYGVVDLFVSQRIKQQRSKQKPAKVVQQQQQQQQRPSEEVEDEYSDDAFDDEHEEEEEEVTSAAEEAKTWDRLLQVPSEDNRPVLDMHPPKSLSAPSPPAVTKTATTGTNTTDSDAVEVHVNPTGTITPSPPRSPTNEASETAEPRKRLLSPSSLRRKLLANVNLLETIESTSLQLNELEHQQALALSQHETVTLVQQYEQEKRNAQEIARIAAVEQASVDYINQHNVQLMNQVEQDKREFNRRKEEEKRYLEQELLNAKRRESGIQTSDTTTRESFTEPLPVNPLEKRSIAVLTDVEQQQQQVTTGTSPISVARSESASESASTGGKTSEEEEYESDDFVEEEFEEDEATDQEVDAVASVTSSSPSTISVASEEDQDIEEEYSQLFSPELEDSSIQSRNAEFLNVHEFGDVGEKTKLEEELKRMKRDIVPDEGFLLHNSEILGNMVSLSEGPSTPVALSPPESPSSSGSFREFTKKLLHNYQQDVENRRKHENELLKLREKALREKTREQLKWLIHQKKLMLQVLKEKEKERQKNGSSPRSLDIKLPSAKELEARCIEKERNIVTLFNMNKATIDSERAALNERAYRDDLNIRHQRLLFKKMQKETDQLRKKQKEIQLNERNADLLSAFKQVPDDDEAELDEAGNIAAIETSHAIDNEESVVSPLSDLRDEDDALGLLMEQSSSIKFSPSSTISPFPSPKEPEEYQEQQEIESIPEDNLVKEDEEVEEVAEEIITVGESLASKKTVSSASSSYYDETFEEDDTEPEQQQVIVKEEESVELQLSKISSLKETLSGKKQQLESLRKKHHIKEEEVQLVREIKQVDKEIESIQTNLRALSLDSLPSSSSKQMKQDQEESDEYADDSFIPEGEETAGVEEGGESEQDEGPEDAVKVGDGWKSQSIHQEYDVEDSYIALDENKTGNDSSSFVDDDDDDEDSEVAGMISSLACDSFASDEEEGREEPVPQLLEEVKRQNRVDDEQNKSSLAEQRRKEKALLAENITAMLLPELLQQALSKEEQEKKGQTKEEDDVEVETSETVPVRVLPEEEVGEVEEEKGLTESEPEQEQDVEQEQQRQVYLDEDEFGFYDWKEYTTSYVNRLFALIEGRNGQELLNEWKQSVLFDEQQQQQDGATMEDVLPIEFYLSLETSDKNPEMLQINNKMLFDLVNLSLREILTGIKCSVDCRRDMPWARESFHYALRSRMPVPALSDLKILVLQRVLRWDNLEEGPSVSPALGRNFGEEHSSRFGGGMPNQTQHGGWTMDVYERLDCVICAEVQDMESEWVSYEEEEWLVISQVADMMLNDLMIDTAHHLQQLFPR